MNKQGAIGPPVIVPEEISREIHHREPDQGKGVGDWEAFPSIGNDDWLVSLMTKYPSIKGGVVIIARDQFLGSSFSRRSITAWLSATTNSADPSEATVEENFTELANRWHNETDCLSSPSRITGNDTYLKIISMGQKVIPLILEDLKERGGNWYKALRILSGDDPVPAEAQGDIARMKESWLRWGRERGYIK